jgi:hypothetical protein
MNFEGMGIPFLRNSFSCGKLLSEDGSKKLAASSYGFLVEDMCLLDT